MKHSQTYAIGLDVGTTSISAVAVNDKLQVLASVNQPHHATIDDLAVDQSEQSISAIEAVAQQCLRELSQLAEGCPIGLGLTGQMHGLVCCDATGNAISNLITWQDRRCLREREPGVRYLDSLVKQLPRNLRERLGCHIRPGYALATLWTMKQQQNLSEEVSQIVDLCGYLARRLTGCSASIDPTFAASWGVYNLKQKSLDEEIIRLSGLQCEMFPALFNEWNQLGEIDASIAVDWSLPARLPVYLGIGDHQAAALVSLQDLQHDLLINVGTGGQIAWCSEVVIPTDELEVRPFVDGYHLHVGAGQAGGTVWQWYVEQVSGWLSELGIAIPLDQLQIQLTQLCRDQPLEETQNRIQCAPYFLGTRSDSEATGAFTNIQPNNYSLTEVSRSVLIGIVDSLCQLYEQAENRLPELQRVVVAGNLFEYHHWLLDYLRDRMRVTVTQPASREQAATGAATLVWRNKQHK